MIQVPDNSSWTFCTVPDNPLPAGYPKDHRESQNLRHRNNHCIEDSLTYTSLRSGAWLSVPGIFWKLPNNGITLQKKHKNNRIMLQIWHKNNGIMLQIRCKNNRIMLQSMYIISCEVICNVKKKGISEAVRVEG